MGSIKKQFFSIFFISVILSLLLFSVYIIITTRRVVVVENKVGALFIGSVDDKGWSQTHYEGLKTACDKVNLPLYIEENVDENEAACEAAINRLVNIKNCNVIFLTSDGYDSRLNKIFDKYSNVHFYTVSPDSASSNVTTYFARIYQMRYLCGMIAGKMTKSNVIGYVAAMNNTQVNRGINAFAIGAREVNPDVEIKVRFTNSWLDADLERETARKLIQEDGADIITYHSSESNAIDEAEKLGVYSMGYNIVQKERTSNFLTAAIYKWEPIYEAVLTDFEKGNIRADKYYWYGIVYDAVDLSPMSDKIPDDVREMISEREITMINGIDIFMDELHDNNGLIRCKEGERISDNALLRKMDWFVEGVKVYE